MKTFVIHTPKPSIKTAIASFEDTIATGTGEAFAISLRMYSELRVGMPLIILDKRQKKQYEAIISGVEFNSYAANGMGRYDIFFSQSRAAPYNGDEIKLKRSGVAFLGADDQ